MTDKERIAALAQLALDIVELYEDSESARIHLQYKYTHNDDMAQFGLMDAVSNYRKQIESLSEGEA